MNRYYKPERSQVLSNYVTLPFDAIQKRLDIDQAQADEFETDFDKALAEKAAALAGDHRYALVELNKHKDAARQSVLDAGGNPFLAKSSFSKAKAGLTKSMTDGALYAYKNAYDASVNMVDQASKYDKQHLETLQATTNRFNKEYNEVDANGNSGMAAGRSWGQGNTDIRFHKVDADAIVKPIVDNIVADSIETSSTTPRMVDSNGMIILDKRNDMTELKTAEKIIGAVENRLLSSEWKENELKRLHLTEGISGDEADARMRQSAKEIALSYANLSYKKEKHLKDIDMKDVKNSDGTVGVKTTKPPYEDIQGAAGAFEQETYTHVPPAEKFTKNVNDVVAFNKEYNSLISSPGNQDLGLGSLKKIANSTFEQVYNSLKTKDESVARSLIARAKETINNYNDHVRDVQSTLFGNKKEIFSKRDREDIYADNPGQLKTNMAFTNAAIKGTYIKGKVVYDNLVSLTGKVSDADKKKALSLMALSPDGSNKTVNSNLNVLLGGPGKWEAYLKTHPHASAYLSKVSTDLDKSIRRVNSDGSEAKNDHISTSIQYTNVVGDQRFNMTAIMKDPSKRALFLGVNSHENSAKTVAQQLEDQFKADNPEGTFNANNVEFTVTTDPVSGPRFRASYGKYTSEGALSLGSAPAPGVAALGLPRAYVDAMQHLNATKQRLSRSKAGVVSLTDNNETDPKNTIEYGKDKEGHYVEIGAKGVKLRGKELTNFMIGTSNMTSNELVSAAKHYVTDYDASVAKMAAKIEELISPTPTKK